MCYDIALTCFKFGLQCVEFLTKKYSNFESIEIFHLFNSLSVQINWLVSMWGRHWPSHRNLMGQVRLKSIPKFPRVCTVKKNCLEFFFLVCVTLDNLMSNQWQNPKQILVLRSLCIRRYFGSNKQKSQKQKKVVYSFLSYF